MPEIILKNKEKIIDPLIKRITSFIFSTNKNGSKCLIQCRDKFLLVRIDYAHKLWTIPGGKLKKNETYEEAARREVKEEVGVSLRNIRKIGEHVIKADDQQFTVEIFHSTVEDYSFAVDGREIREACWFSREDMPKERGQWVDIAFGMLEEQHGK